MRKRYILTDRAGNQIAGSPTLATQADAISVSRRHAPCWIIEEKAKPDFSGWLYSRDVGYRNDQLDYIPMPLANQGEWIMRIYVNPDIANAAPMLQTTDIHGLHFELGLKGLVTLVKEFPRSRIMPIKILRQLYDGRLGLNEAKDIIDYVHSIMEAAKLI